MIKSGKRNPFQASTPLNTPITIHKIDNSSHISNEDFLGFLNNFIEDKDTLESTTPEANNNINIDTSLIASLAQLKRIQRDLKGLPPLSQEKAPIASSTTITTTIKEEQGEEDKDSSVKKSATGAGKKIVFD